MLALKPKFRIIRLLSSPGCWQQRRRKWMLWWPVLLCHKRPGGFFPFCKTQYLCFLFTFKSFAFGLEIHGLWSRLPWARISYGRHVEALEANIIFVADVANIVRGAKFSYGAFFTPHGKFTNSQNL